MLYLNREHIGQIGVDWNRVVQVIEEAVETIKKTDYAQPVKPYLRYGDPKNRIIAMPGYIGGDSPMAGIKWIASFPDNIYKNKLRANSVTILNEFDTGIPVCTINTSFLSAVRTAAVSGVMVKKYVEIKSAAEYSVGIIGFGPIGAMHLKMIRSILGEKLKAVCLYDVRNIDIDDIERDLKSKITVCKSWEDCYPHADIFITCTVSPERYIDKEPKKGSLQLNVSLRDYRPEIGKYMDIIVVDDWDEVCRQNTDIENMQREIGLVKADTLSLSEFFCDSWLGFTDKNKTIMFNPMGMAVFDIAIGGYYYREAMKTGIGITVPD